VLNWIGRLLGSAGRGIDAAVAALIRAGLSGLAAAVEFVFKDVTSAWTSFEHATLRLADSLGHDAEAKYRELERLVLYDIPHYAITAWWWITHPGDLADQLGWHIVRWLEDHAWEAAHWLGGFGVSLVLHNARRFTAAIESILAAVL
jgi:hypothetical protein